ncbi:MAG: diaminopimelate epimerase [Actinomycetota bacterium]|jgi:diaminopimelate epimerase|nr:diaminopimelate epimerase [Actinomycetota bacterium]
MQFVKVHGAGNDFVLLPDPQDAQPLTPGVVRELCRAHLGLGADGVIRVAPPREGVDADVFMDYWNADGNIAEMCGNGVRCVAKYLADRNLAGNGIVTVDTRAGVKAVQVFRDGNGLVDRARVDMGPPVVGKVDEPLDIGGATVGITTLSMGNPHAVLVVDDVASEPLAELGTRIGRHEAFAEGTNVELIQILDRRTVRGRIWERGVGETMASGTGASAMAVAAAVLGLAERQVTVALPGGELDIDWSDATLWVTGPAVEVATGNLDETWLKSIR